MQKYVDRIMRCGVSASEAVRLYKAMVRDFGFDALEELIASMERDCYVD